jgi:hypothetical protein
MDMVFMPSNQDLLVCYIQGSSFFWMQTDFGMTVVSYM